MKKFGTPIGAGPGSDSENVGMDGVGAPVCFAFLWVEAFGLGLGLGALCFFAGGLGGLGWCDEGVWTLAGPVGWGGLFGWPVVVELDVVVELEVDVEVDVEVGVELDVVGVELELEVEVELDVELGVDEVVELDVELLELELDPELVVEVVVGVKTIPGKQLSVSDTTTPVTGRTRDEMGVFGGTFTSNVYCCPPTTNTVILQASADAVGSAITAIVAAANASVTTSFRLLDTMAYLLLPARVRNRSVPRPHGGV
jgi:hypothetical protein